MIRKLALVLICVLIYSSLAVSQQTTLSGKSALGGKAKAGHREPPDSSHLAFWFDRTVALPVTSGSVLNSGMNTAFSYYIVTTAQASGGFEVHSGHNSQTFWGGRTPDARSIQYNTGNTASNQNGQIGAPNQLSIEACTYDGAKRLQANGNAEIYYIATGNLGLNGSLTIGAYSTGEYPWDGSIQEVLVYNVAHTLTQSRTVLDYLNTRWHGFSRTDPYVIFDGNSLTAGTGTIGSGTDLSYPSQLIKLLGGSWNYANIGVGGQTTTSMSADAPTQIDLVYDSRRSKNIVVPWEITNELKNGVSATTAYNDYVAYCQARRLAGPKVIAVPVLPRSDDGTPGDFEASRQTVNALIRANWPTFADGLADVAADSRIGDAGDELDLTYYTPDRVHLNATGYGVVAEVERPVILAQ